MKNTNNLLKSLSRELHKYCKEQKLPSLQPQEIKDFLNRSKILSGTKQYLTKPILTGYQELWLKEFHMYWLQALQILTKKY